MTSKLIRPITASNYTQSISVSSAGTYKSSAAVYLATVNVPRIEFNKDGGGRVLLENAATNLLIQSGTFTDAAWVATDCTFNKAYLGPYQGEFASWMAASTASGTHKVKQTVANPNGIPNQMTGSIFVSVGNSNLVMISLEGSVSGSASIKFDLNTNTAYEPLISGFTGLSYSIDPFYNSSLTYPFVRISVTATTNFDPNVSFNVYVLDRSDNNYTNRLANYANAIIFIWGAQLELGALTSYIPTTTVAVTRTIDNVLYDTYTNLDNQGIADYSITNLYVTGQQIVASDNIIYESLTGSSNGLVTMTIASPCVVTWTAHGFADGTPIYFITNGALPTGITASQIYYIKTPTTNTFNLATTVGGTAINTSGTQSGAHTAYASTNKGFNPASNANPTYWLRVKTCNKWAMFDSVISNASTNASPSVNIAALVRSTSYIGNGGGYIDSVALLNSICKIARVVVYSGSDINGPTAYTVLYDKTYSGVSNSGVNDLYAYFFEPIAYKQDIVMTDIPRAYNASVSVVLSGVPVNQCGECIIGLSKQMGLLQSGGKVGLQDYSVKATDTFGNYSISERGFSNKATFSIWVDNYQVDNLKNILASYRATPILYVGDNKYGSTFVYGFYKDFGITFTQPTTSLCDIELEGLL